MSYNKRYPDNYAFKNSSPSTIEGACRKSDICVEFVKYRDKYRDLKIEYEKAEVKLEQMEQLKKDNATKLIQITKKNDTINKLHTTITQLDNDNKVKISQLKKELSEFKNTGNNPSLIRNLQCATTELREQLEKAKEEHIHFNTIWKTEGITEQDIIDMKRQIRNHCDLIKGLKEEHTQYRMEIDKLKDDLHLSKASHKRLTEENILLKQEHGELIEKLEKRDKLITALNDLE